MSAEVIIPHITERILTEIPRERLIEAQRKALDIFMFLRRNSPAFIAEERCNRAILARKRSKDRRSGR